MSAQISKVSPLARLCFCGLWCLADREGILENQPEQIQAYLFPYEKSVKIEELLKELGQAELIQFYEKENFSLIFIPNFVKHQNIHKKETSSELPEPQETILSGNYPEIRERVSRIHSTRESTGKSTREKPKDEKIPFAEILSHLKEMTGLVFSPKGTSNRRFIRARWNDGFKFEDFKAVNKVKAEEWLNTDQAKYLRPETLYGPKFEGYVNQASLPKIEKGEEGGSVFDHTNA